MLLALSPWPEEAFCHPIFDQLVQTSFSIFIPEFRKIGYSHVAILDNELYRVRLTAKYFDNGKEYERLYM